MEFIAIQFFEMSLKDGVVCKLTENSNINTYQGINETIQHNLDVSITRIN